MGDSKEAFMQNSRNRNQTRREKNKAIIIKMVMMACLISIVIIFQLIGSFIKVGPASISLVLIPIAIGAILLGPLFGALLGAIFGVMTLAAGISGVEPFTATLWANQPFETAVLCIAKGTLAGLFSGLIYKLLKKINDFFAVVIASAIVPVVNTFIFILGGIFIVNDTLSAMVSDGKSLVYFVVFVCSLANFIAEFILNIVASPAIKYIALLGNKALNNFTKPSKNKI